MKKFLKIFLGIILLVIVISACAVFYFSRGLEEGASLPIYGVDPSAFEDGTYQGRYDGGRWSNELSVTILNHQISSIEIKKDVLVSKPEVTSELLKRVISEQTTKVDAVSGATVTCNAYLKSIENALHE